MPGGDGLSSHTRGNPCNARFLRRPGDEAAASIPATVVEADLTERGDPRDREIALRCLGVGGPGRLVVCIDFCGRGGAQGPAVLDHLVADIAVEQSGDIGIVAGVADKSVGNAVLARRAG